MTEDIVDLFLKLASIPAPSGFEEPMIRAFMEEMRPYVDSIIDTPRGNVVAKQLGTDEAAPKIALVAHLDQVGFVVINIDQRGFLRFRKLGGSITRAIQGQHLVILGEKGDVPGVVGTKPGHVTTVVEANTIPPIEEMYIDVGARSKEEAEELGLEVGSAITFAPNHSKLANGLIASTSVDDRAGVSALIEIARSFSENRPRATVYYIGTVEEETGLRGAETALFNVDVDMAVAIDTFPSGYQPDVNMRDILYEVGSGPGIHVGQIGDRIRIDSRQVHRWLVNTASKHDIPHQIGLMHGSNDAAALMQTRGGIPSASIGIPRRYSHGPVEVFDPKDLENLIRIIKSAISGLGPEFKNKRV
jgi:endoglucanase